MKYCTIIAILLFGACNSNSEKQNNITEETEDHKPTVFAEPAEPHDPSIDAPINSELETGLVGDDRFPHYKSIEANIDDDDDIETIYITADAMIDEKGRVAWSDGHVWEVYAEYGDKQKFLYVRDLQLGKLLMHHNDDGDIFLEEVGPHTKKKYQLKNGSFSEVTEVPNGLTTIDLTSD